MIELLKLLLCEAVPSLHTLDQLPTPRDNEEVPGPVRTVEKEMHLREAAMLGFG